jgi:hypothetical protein
VLFTPYQILIILRTVLTPDDIAASGGPIIEVQRRILRDPTRPVRNLLAMTLLLVEHNLLPFDEQWVRPIMRLYELEEAGDIVSIEHEFAALFGLATAVIAANLASVPSRTRKSALFFAAKYLGAFSKAKQAVYAKAKVTALAGSSQYFQILIDDMRQERDLCAVLIKGIASANIVVNRWNATPHADRATPVMKTFIRRSRYITWAMKQMEKWPRNDKPAFNVLGIASCFHRRRYYPHLLEALIRANPKSKTDLNYKFETYPDYADPDFDDFRAWLAQRGHGTSTSTDLLTSGEQVHQASP